MSQRTIGDATRGTGAELGICPALAKGGLERGTPSAFRVERGTPRVSVRELPDLEPAPAAVGAPEHEAVALTGLLHRQDVSDLGMQFALFNPRLHGLRTAVDQIVVLGQDAEPQAVSA